jgi:hypothetical protein
LILQVGRADYSAVVKHFRAGEFRLREVELPGRDLALLPQRSDLGVLACDLLAQERTGSFGVVVREAAAELANGLEEVGVALLQLAEAVFRLKRDAQYRRIAVDGFGQSSEFFTDGENGEGVGRIFDDGEDVSLGDGLPLADAQAFEVAALPRDDLDDRLHADDVDPPGNSVGIFDHDAERKDQCEASGEDEGSGAEQPMRRAAQKFMHIRTQRARSQMRGNNGERGFRLSWHG